VSPPGPAYAHVPGAHDSLCPFWQKRCYDGNEANHKEFVEKLKCIHRARRGPRRAPILRWLRWKSVKRGLVELPKDWAWSRYRHYASSDDCGVAIESWRSRSYTLNPTPANW